MEEIELKYRVRSKTSNELFKMDNGDDHWYYRVQNYLVNPIWIKEVDKKYGSGASKFMGEALKLIKEGTLDMALGSDKVEEYKSQSVSWYKNGVMYLIMNMAYDDVGKDAMLEMANTIINKF